MSEIASTMVSSYQSILKGNFLEVSNVILDWRLSNSVSATGSLRGCGWEAESIVIGTFNSVSKVDFGYS